MHPSRPRRTGAVNSLRRPASGPADSEVRFADRHDAGRRLAALLGRWRDEHPVVVAIPRGGVPVGAEVARALDAPLDVVVVRKIGSPGNPEYAIGALAEGDIRVLSGEAVRALGLGGNALEALVNRTQDELEDRLRRYRGARAPLPLDGRTVLLVDDGLATGRSARAAALAVRQRGAARIVLAVPVAAPSSVEALRDCVDEVVSVRMPDDLWAIGLWYEDFRPTSDDEVARLLAQFARGGPGTAREVLIDAGPDLVLAGDLTLPDAPRGVVAFAHGSGSSRRSPRNRLVATMLQQAGIATLLFDLLTAREAVDRANVFDIALLAERLVAATDWLACQPDTRELALGYFGASTGAAAALVAAAQPGAHVRAIVSRGGRPDLAGTGLGAVRAATLLIVGGEDRQVLALNRAARRRLRCTSELAVVPGATHLFEEPGALEQVARLAIAWFTDHLATPTPAAEPTAHTHRT